MDQVIWRRKHGTDIIAEASSDDGAWWRASTWRVSDFETIIARPKWAQTRHAACAVADDLARKTFGHKCDFVTCADWRRFDIVET
jgi:hypothetical protein